ncbi:MAG: hypothetical protein NC110_07590 [Ruminococcus sp.]|nr:hypothetical protein [Ruminococcus sp.]
MLKMTLKRDEYILIHKEKEIERVSDEVCVNEDGSIIGLLYIDSVSKLRFRYYTLGEVGIFTRDFYERNINGVNI